MIENRANSKSLPTPSGERWNVVTHGVGLAASVAATALLVLLAAFTRDPWLVVGVSVFGASLIVLYAASTFYHAARPGSAKRRLRAFDHSAIYLLIAGTYTPFVLSPLRGGWGWSLFGVAWGVALAGVIVTLFAAGRFPRISTAIYLALGWMVIVAIVPVVRRVPAETIAWLVAGGVAYTAGTAFYGARRLRHGHAIWHLFVLAGSTAHAVAVGTLLRG